MLRFTLRIWLIGILISQVVFLPVTQAEIDAGSGNGNGNGTGNGSFTVKKEEPTYKTGSVFISSNKKNEVLLKASIWGAVQFPGVHYIPIGTRFLDALSFAGGPVDSANMDTITLSSKTVTANAIGSVRELSVSDAITTDKKNPIIQPDDIIVVKQDHVRDNIALYIAIGTFLVSAAALGLVISDHR